MSDIILPDSFEAAKIGSPVELTLKIANNGAAATGDYTIDLYVDIDTNGAYDAATDLMLKQWTSEETPVVPYDPTGSGYNVVYINTRNLDIVYPEVTEGSYTIRGEVIPNEGMTEYDDTNNAAAEGGIAFVESLADLSMKRMSSTLASAIAEADGGTITLSYILTNEGTEDATGSFSVAFYATEDDVIDTGTDISLGSDALTDVTIAARGFLSDSFTAAFPAGQGAGFYTVYWVIDSGGAVSEANETNNQPSSVDECYVFPFVSDGITDITARVLAYKPQGVAATYCDVRMYAYNDGWAQTAYASGGTTNPGTLYSSNLQMTLGSGDTVGLRFREWGYTNIPIAFIVVPEYVAGYGAGGIPSALNGQDSYEPNNDTTTAYALSGSANPLFGFLVILIDASTDASDYFTFTVP